MLAFFLGYFLCIITLPIFHMLKIVSIIIIIGAVGIAVFTAYVRETQPLASYEVKQLFIGGTSLRAYVADTEEKRTQGLMGVSELAADSGMLFIFPDTSPRKFWNKNTLLDLGLIWIADERVIGISKLPAITQSGNIITVSSPGAISDVVEVPVGWVDTHEIEVGDRVE